MANLELLIGKTLTSVVNKDNQEIIFTVDNGDEYRMYHSQDCCENVSVDDIVGDLQDLVGSPILKAEESESEEHTAEQEIEIAKEKAECLANGTTYYDYDESFTWTFYKLATIKGYVDIKWLGESNGYYSESVDFVLIGSNEDY